MWDTPPDGFKTAALIGKYNEIKNKFFSYCRAKQFGESGDAGYVDSTRQAVVEGSFRPVFQLFIEANMQNKAAAVPPFTISGSGTTGNELVKNGATAATGMHVDLVLLRPGGRHGKDSEGKDTKWRPDRPRSQAALSRTRTVAPPVAEGDECIDDTLPIECYNTSGDSAPSSQEPVKEPVKKKTKRATVVAAMAAAQDLSDQKFIDAMKGQSDQLMKMIAPSTPASTSSGHQELEELFPLLEQAHAAALRCTDPLDPMRPFHQTRIEYYEAQIRKVTAHATHSPRY